MELRNAIRGVLRPGYAVFGLLFLLPLRSDAQVDSLKRLQFGAVYGIFDYEVEVSPPGDYAPYRGSTAGVALRYFDRQLVGFQAELSYTRAGWEESLLGAEIPNYRRSFDYAELLILTQFSPGNGFFQPCFVLGPYLSIPLSQTESPLPADFLDTELDYYGRDLDFRINYGGQVGLGFNLEIGPLTLQATGRFLVGFSDLIKPGESQVSSIRRRGLGGAVTAFYALPGGKSRNTTPPPALQE